MSSFKRRNSVVRTMLNDSHNFDRPPPSLPTTDEEKTNSNRDNITDESEEEKKSSSQGTNLFDDNILGGSTTSSNHNNMVTLMANHPFNNNHPLQQSVEDNNGTNSDSVRKNNNEKNKKNSISKGASNFTTGFITTNNNPLRPGTISYVQMPSIADYAAPPVKEIVIPKSNNDGDTRTLTSSSYPSTTQTYTFDGNGDDVSNLDMSDFNNSGRGEKTTYTTVSHTYSASNNGKNSRHPRYIKKGNRIEVEKDESNNNNDEDDNEELEVKSLYERPIYNNSNSNAIGLVSSGRYRQSSGRHLIQATEVNGPVANDDYADEKSYNADEEHPYMNITTTRSKCQCSKEFGLLGLLMFVALIVLMVGATILPELLLSPNNSNDINPNNNGTYNDGTTTNLNTDDIVDDGYDTNFNSTWWPSPAPTKTDPTLSKKPSVLEDSDNYYSYPSLAVTEEEAPIFVQDGGGQQQEEQNYYDDDETQQIPNLPVAPEQTQPSRSPSTTAPTKRPFIVTNSPTITTIQPTRLPVMNSPAITVPRTRSPVTNDPTNIPSTTKTTITLPPQQTGEGGEEDGGLVISEDLNAFLNEYAQEEFFVVEIWEYNKMANFSNNSNGKNLSSKEAFDLYREYWKTEILPVVRAQVVMDFELRHSKWDEGMVIRYESGEAYRRQLRLEANYNNVIHFQQNLLNKDAAIQDHQIFATTLNTLDIPAALTQPPLAELPFPPTDNDPTFLMYHELTFLDVPNYNHTSPLPLSQQNTTGRESMATNDALASPLKASVGIRAAAWLDVQVPIRTSILMEDNYIGSIKRNIPHQIRIEIVPSWITYGQVIIQPQWRLASKYREAALKPIPVSIFALPISTTNLYYYEVFRANHQQ